MSRKMSSQERTQLRRIQGVINAAIERTLDSLWGNEPPNEVDILIIEKSGKILAEMLTELGERE